MNENEITVERSEHHSDYISDYIIVFLFCFIFTTSCFFLSTHLFHWFICPVSLCGVLIGVDAVRWFRGRYDLFDPKGILGILGLHFFFAAPILAVAWDVHTKYTGVRLEDLRPWIGIVAFFNIFGLLIYRLVESKVASRPYRPTAKVWKLNESRWFWVLILLIIIALIGQIYLLSTRGIISRVVYEERWEIRGGTGIYRLLGYALPVLMLMFLTIIRNKMTPRKSNIIITYLILFLLISLSFVTGGLAGSRSSTVWALFWLVGIIHFYWRRITVKQAVLGFIVLCFFMYIYGFYKKLGLKGLAIMKSEGFAAASYESGVTVRGIMLGDLSRADVHAYMAYVLTDKPYPYKYRWGATIWGDVLVQFPVWIYSNFYNLSGSSGKMIAGTDIMMGPGFFDPYDPYRKSRYVYGLIGQVMLNFGVFFIPFAYIILGYCVGRSRRAFLNWQADDMRFFLTPVITNLLFQLLISDLNNLLNFTIFRIAYPLLAVWLISYKLPRYSYSDTDTDFY